jgi:hypothetical protein
VYIVQKKKWCYNHTIKNGHTTTSSNFYSRRITPDPTNGLAMRILSVNDQQRELILELEGLQKRVSIESVVEYQNNIARGANREILG